VDFSQDGGIVVFDSFFAPDANLVDFANFEDQANPVDLAVPPFFAAETSGTGEDLRGVFAAPGEAGVVGTNATVLWSKGDGFWLIGMLASQALGDFNGEYAASGQWVLVGDAGNAWQSPVPQGAWSAVSAPSSVDLQALWIGVGQTVDAYAVGSGGSILYRDLNGTTGWQSATSPTRRTLRAIWGTDLRDMFVAGDFDGTQGTLLRSIDPFRFQSLTSGTTRNLLAVWGSSLTDVYAAGDGGTLLHSTDGMSFTAQQSGTAARLRGLWGSSGADIYAVGDGGTVLHSTGAGDWAPVASGTTRDLYAVSGSSPDDLYLVGAAGTILHHRR
jgi:hypothetical protein